MTMKHNENAIFLDNIIVLENEQPFTYISNTLLFYASMSYLLNKEDNLIESVVVWYNEEIDKFGIRVSV